MMTDLFAVDWIDWDEAAWDALQVHMVETNCPSLSVRERVGVNESLYYCSTCGEELAV